VSDSTRVGALQQNRAQSRLLYLFYDKESGNFPMHSAEFTVFKPNFVVKESGVCRVLKLCSGHALVGSLCWDDQRTSVTTLYVSLSLSVVWGIEHFNNDKASHLKQRQINNYCCFLSSFHFLSKIPAFVANVMSFFEALFRLRICLFCYVFCWWESSKTWLWYSFTTSDYCC